jgi:prepilin signal peptidase PulO-like enzyme (type II secretory pathway)
MTLLQSDLTYPATASACALVGSVFDVKSRRIPNFVTVPAFLLGLAMHLALGGWRQLLTSLPRE